MENTCRVVSYRNSTSNHNISVHRMNIQTVVSYRNSTSNHNDKLPCAYHHELYLIEILHQTTTLSLAQVKNRKLYLIEILHQTTTVAQVGVAQVGLYLIEILHQTTTMQKQSELSYGCILSKFYIKPQRSCCRLEFCDVVSYRNSTSNHNNDSVSMSGVSVVSYRNSTSNHNAGASYVGRKAVVSYRNSTSNHNMELEDAKRPGLYLIEILHQTTTRTAPNEVRVRCILSKFYIKPQL